MSEPTTEVAPVLSAPLSMTQPQWERLAALREEAQIWFDSTTINGHERRLWLLMIEVLGMLAGVAEGVVGAQPKPDAE